MPTWVWHGSDGLYIYIYENIYIKARHSVGRKGKPGDGQEAPHWLPFIRITNARASAMTADIRAELRTHRD